VVSFGCPDSWAPICRGVADLGSEFEPENQLRAARRRADFSPFGTGWAIALKSIVRRGVSVTRELSATLSTSRAGWSRWRSSLARRLHRSRADMHWLIRRSRIRLREGIGACPACVRALDFAGAGGMESANAGTEIELKLTPIAYVRPAQSAAWAHHPEADRLSDSHSYAYSVSTSSPVLDGVALS